MSRSPMRMDPPLGGTKPAIMRSVVVLPQPEGPSSTRNSPSFTSSETDCTTVLSP